MILLASLISSQQLQTRTNSQFWVNSSWHFLKSIRLLTRKDHTCILEELNIYTIVYYFEITSGIKRQCLWQLVRDAGVYHTEVIVNKLCWWFHSKSVLSLPILKICLSNSHSSSVWIVSLCVNGYSIKMLHVAQNPSPSFQGSFQSDLTDSFQMYG